MNPRNGSIITEDGQRLTIDNGQITGTENPEPGLAYETGNVLDETNQQGEGGGACRISVNKGGENANAQEPASESDSDR